MLGVMIYSTVIKETTVKLDPFHLMRRYPIKLGSHVFKTFPTMLSSAIFIDNVNDMNFVKESLMDRDAF